MIVDLSTVSDKRIIKTSVDNEEVYIQINFLEYYNNYVLIILDNSGNTIKSTWLSEGINHYYNVNQNLSGTVNGGILTIVGIS